MNSLLKKKKNKSKKPKDGKTKSKTDKTKKTKTKKTEKKQNFNLFSETNDQANNSTKDKGMFKADEEEIDLAIDYTINENKVVEVARNEQTNWDNEWVDEKALALAEEEKKKALEPKKKIISWGSEAFEEAKQEINLDEAFFPDLDNLDEAKETLKNKEVARANLAANKRRDDTGSGLKIFNSKAKSNLAKLNTPLYANITPVRKTLAGGDMEDGGLASFKGKLSNKIEGNAFGGLTRATKENPPPAYKAPAPRTNYAPMTLSRGDGSNIPAPDTNRAPISMNKGPQLSRGGWNAGAPTPQDEEDSGVRTFKNSKKKTGNTLLSGIKGNGATAVKKEEPKVKTISPPAKKPTGRTITAPTRGKGRGMNLPESYAGFGSNKRGDAQASKPTFSRGF